MHVWANGCGIQGLELFGQFLGSSFDVTKAAESLIKGKLGDAVVIFVFGYQLFLAIFFS